MEASTVRYRVGGIVDLDAGRVTGPATIIVEGGRITRITDEAGEPSATRDYSQWIAMPGLIDSHTHLSISTPGNDRAQVARPIEERVLRATQYCERMLAEGVTTIRDMGEPAWLDIRLRDAFEQGIFRGPRLVVSGRIIAASHAHVSVVDYPADGDEVITRVRENIAQKVDWIKLYATPSSLLGNPHESYYSQEEVDRIVTTAKRANLPVAAHAHGGAGADYCIDAGVDTIEHGRYLSDEQLRRMADQGIALCSTVGIGVFAAVQRTRQTVEEALATTQQAVGEALRIGVSVIPGTDAVHGQLHFEMRALEFFGLTRLQTLRAATIEAARVLRREQDLARIAEGYYADFSLLAEDPLTSEQWPKPKRTIINGQEAWRSMQSESLLQ